MEQSLKVLVSQFGIELEHVILRFCFEIRESSQVSATRRPLVKKTGLEWTKSNRVPTRITTAPLSQNMECALHEIHSFLVQQLLLLIIPFPFCTMSSSDDESTVSLSDDSTTPTSSTQDNQDEASTFVQTTLVSTETLEAFHDYYFGEDASPESMGILEQALLTLATTTTEDSGSDANDDLVRDLAMDIAAMNINQEVKIDDTDNLNNE